MELINRVVYFTIRDVYIPEPQVLLSNLYGDAVLQGRVVGLSDSGIQKEVFAVLEVEGIEQPVIVSTERI